VHARDEQLDNQWRGDVVREIGNKLRRDPPACAVFEIRLKLLVHLMLAGKRITFDQREVLALREAFPQHARQITIDLHRNHLSPPTQQLLRQRSRSGSNFDNHLTRLNQPRVGDDPHEVLIDHEVLPEAVTRSRTRCVEDRLNFLLGLCHGVILYASGYSGRALVERRSHGELSIG
jgi:hypothetical protein